MKRKRTYPKSTNKIKFDFKPNNTIYEKTVQDGNIKNTIKLNIEPQKPNEPTIKSITRIKEEK